MQIGSTEWNRLLENGAGKMGFSIEPDQIARFTTYAGELTHWSRKINLTTIRSPKEIAVKHFLDSAAPIGCIPAKASLLDVGSGAGFPGIPLKILVPTLSVTLVESSRKKVSFLKHIIRRLQLGKIEAVEGRVGEVSKDTRFDVILSRAVTNLASFIQMGSPLLARGGLMITYKGKDVEAELSMAAEALGDLFSFETVNYMLPFFDIERSLVVIRSCHSG